MSELEKNPIIQKVEKPKPRYWNEQITCPFCGGTGNMGKVTAIVIRRVLLADHPKQDGTEL